MSYIDVLDTKLRRAADYPIGNGVVPSQFKNTMMGIMKCSGDLLRTFGHNAAVHSLSEYEASRCPTH